MAEDDRGETIGTGSDRHWVEVLIGGTRCLLAADTRRSGIERYLRSVLASSAPTYGVTASTKGVIERVGVGEPPERISGFYLYTASPFPSPTLLHPDAPEFSSTDVALLLLEAIHVLHQEGHQRLLIFPGLSGSGLHWRTLITPPDNFVDSDFGVQVKDYDLGFFWTSGEGLRIGELGVTAQTTPEDAANFVLGQLRISGYGEDLAYAHWYQGLLSAAKRLRRLPIACKDWEDNDPGWELDGHVRYALPPGAR